MQKFTIIDVETPNKFNNSICQFGIRCICDGKETINESPLINPESFFSNTNINIHGITPEMVVNAPTIKEYWDTVSNFFDDAIIIGHNVRFDLCVLSKALFRYGITLPEYPIICTWNLAEKYLSLEKNSLHNVCEHLNIPVGKAHDAGDDVDMCFAVFSALTENRESLLPEIAYYQFCCDRDSSRKTRPEISDTSKAILELKQVIESIMSDGVIEEQEVWALEYWLSQHEELSGYYPYDKICATVCNVLEDNIITLTEYEELQHIFQGFINPISTEEAPACIVLEGKTFCLTGDFEHGDRASVEQLLASKGGIRKSGVSSKLDYLIVGDKGSQAWKFGNYGGKIQRAMELKENGSAIQVISETDFFNGHC